MANNNKATINVVDSKQENAFLNPFSPSRKYATEIYPSVDIAIIYPITMTTVPKRLKYPYSTGEI